ncbi:hypothetical protein Dimus_017777, partial [Dionaea muscipula]
RGDAVNDDDVPLSLKYQVPPQALIHVGTDLEVVDMTTAEREVEIVDENPSSIDEDEELFGIDDVDAFIEITIEKTVDDIF